jgi:hypothetical protein
VDLLQTVLNAQNGAVVEQIGRSFGLDQAQTTSAIGQLLPALVAGLSHQTAQPGGMEGLMGALTGGTHQRYLDDASTLTLLAVQPRLRRGREAAADLVTKVRSTIRF